ncbi:MAG: hypothetical protein Q8L14_12845, partial [Myxococcales bacterium]|nr:hypothetical protein [Myxococcales bacterium]
GKATLTNVTIFGNSACMSGLLTTNREQNRAPPTNWRPRQSLQSWPPDSNGVSHVMVSFWHVPERN